MRLSEKTISGFWLLARRAISCSYKAYLSWYLPELSGSIARPLILCNLKFDLVIGDPFTTTLA